MKFTLAIQRKNETHFLSLEYGALVFRQLDNATFIFFFCHFGSIFSLKLNAYNRIILLDVNAM